MSINMDLFKKYYIPWNVGCVMVDYITSNIMNLLCSNFSLKYIFPFLIFKKTKFEIKINNINVI